MGSSESQTFNYFMPNPVQKTIQLLKPLWGGGLKSKLKSRRYRACIVRNVTGSSFSRYPIRYYKYTSFILYQIISLSYFVCVLRTGQNSEEKCRLREKD